MPPIREPFSKPSTELRPIQGHPVTNCGTFADGRTYSLPDDWLPLRAEVLSVGIESTRAAIIDEDDALRRLTYYYSRKGNYSGTSFLDSKPNPANEIVAADLYAVSRLSMTIRNDQGRYLLDVGVPRATALDLLAAIPEDATIEDLSAPLLVGMWNLYDHFRCLLVTADRKSNHWVFAAKLCARKRPNLFPVRDGLVCEYLSGSRLPKQRAHRIGQFRNDIQLFAHLMTKADFIDQLAHLQAVCAQHGVAVDQPMLRFLDVLLWTKAAASRS